MFKWIPESGTRKSIILDSALSAVSFIVMVANGAVGNGYWVGVVNGSAFTIGFTLLLDDFFKVWKTKYKTK